MATSRIVGWKTRVGVVLSLIWLALAFAIANSERETAGVFAVIGVLPIAALWGIVWIVRGYLEQRKPTSDTQAPFDKDKWRNRLIGIALLVAAMVLVEYFGGRAGRGASHYGYVIGYYIWIPIVAWIVWSYTLKQKPGSFILLIGISFFLAGSWEAYKLNLEYVEAKAFSKAGTALLARMMDGEQVSTAQIAEAKLGRYEPILTVAAAFFDSVRQGFREYESVAAISSVGTLLAPSTFANESSIFDAMTRIGNLRKAADASEKKIMLALERTQVDSIAADLPPEVRRNFMQGFDESSAATIKQVSEYFSIQREMLDKAQVLAILMRSRIGRFQVDQSNRVIFQNSADLALYNQYIRDIQTLVTREAEWSNASRGAAINTLRRLNDATSRK